MPAAGIGSRMAADIPKQYLPLNNRTVIEWTLFKLLSVDRIQHVVVAVAEHDSHWSQLAISRHSQVRTAVGGKQRADSVLNSLQALDGLAAEHDWVLVHDAARPCVGSKTVDDLIDGLESEPVGGILAVPVADTLKLASHETPPCIAKTIDRNHIWAAQTPQMFRFGLLKRALISAQQDGFAVTDEASAIEHMGFEPRLVAGRSDNLKITTPDDLVLAQLIMANQKQADEV